MPNRMHKTRFELCVWKITLNKQWSIESWISLKASRARRLAATWSMSASSSFWTPSLIPGNFTAFPIAAAATLFLFLLLWHQTLAQISNTKFHSKEEKESKKERKIRKLNHDELGVFVTDRQVGVLWLAFQVSLPCQVFFYSI